MAGRAMTERGHRRAAFFASQRAGLGSQYELGLREGLTQGGGKLPEEFVRYLTQTRLGKILTNNAAGWLIASVIWASLHLPSFYANNTRGFVYALLGVVTILPLGLLWSFINHRTRSIVPAVLVHGTNLWALQDL